MMPTLLRYSWNQFDKAVDTMATAIQWRVRASLSPKFTNIYGIPRGGLVLAVALSHRLELPLTDCVGSRTLVADDISDTGHTLEPYKSNFIVTLHYVKGSRVEPNLYVDIKSPDVWIVYPWETNKSSKEKLHV